MSSIFFQEEGAGPALVFLHGFCETREIWGEFTRPLNEHFRVIVPDLPGFGKSQLLPVPVTIDKVGDALAKWLFEKKILSSIIIGHSLGGYVALSLAEYHPELVNGLVLFHSTVYADSEEKKDNRNRVIEFVKSHGVQPFIDTLVPGLFFEKSSPAIQTAHRIASETNLTTLIEYSRAMRDREDRSQVMRKNELPKILIAGAEDLVVPIQASREMAKIGQNSGFYELDNVAHMGIFEAKNECQSIIKRFADRIFTNK